MRSRIRAKLLAVAGVRELEMWQAVRSLLEQSARFVGIKVDKPAAKVVSRDFVVFTSSSCPMIFGHRAWNRVAEEI